MSGGGGGTWQRGEASSASGAHRLADDAREEIARLRAQAERLISERVTPALGQASDSIRHQADRSRETIDSLADTVREQPLLAIAIAAVSGYVVGRLLGGASYVSRRIRD
ncbi:MAG: hypothetical protein JWP29_5550 [Rhodoferax sp.]|nr:hypothetical protein [Rhodoferax sp.]